MSEFDADIRRVLVRSVNWVGDAVLALPALTAVRRRFPQAEVAVLAAPWVAGLFRGQPGIARVLELVRGGLRDRWRQAGELRAEGFDLAVLFPNSFDAALLACLARIPRRVGYATDGRGLLLTHAIPAPPRGGRHQVHWYLGLARVLGAEADSTPRLEVSAAARDAALQLLRRSGIRAGEPLVALNPGSVYGTAKRWPVERFAAVADGLAAQGARIALVGSAREAPILGDVAAAMRTPALVLAGQTDLPTLAAVLQQSRLLLTNDTGAMHVAAAVGTPVVAVFGPTDAEATGPFGLRATVVRQAVPCSPCLFRECPIDHRCMRDIPIERVLEAALSMLAHEEFPRDGEGAARQPRGGDAAASADATPGIRAGGLRPAAFLDRDGTIIEDLGYLGDPAQIKLIPGAVEALQALQSAGYRLVLITNQAGVARGLITEVDVRRVNEALRAMLGQAGITFDAVYYCPHHPEHGTPEYRLQCECRKPGPGMVRRAAADVAVDPGRSVVIGDHSSDTMIAKAFPGMRAVLVRTGHGAGQAEKVERGEVERPHYVAADLREAVRWLLAGTEAAHGIASHPA